MACTPAEIADHFGREAIKRRYRAANATDAVREATERVVKAATAYVKNSRTGRDCTDEYHTYHREEDEEAIHDAVDAILAAERAASDGGQEAP